MDLLRGLIEVLGRKGIMLVTGGLFFVYSLHYSRNIFQWIEDQTLGTRNHILEKLELLFIDVEPIKITYVLLFLSCGVGSITFLIFGFFGRWVLGVVFALILSYFGFKMPKPIINMLVERRMKRYSLQMVDALTLLSNGIRAGLSVPQSLGMVVSEMPKPISQEFNMILQQNRIGIPLEDCFDNLAKRVPTEDNDMFVSSVNILRETGGNLAETFDTIVDVIRERVRLQQKIDTYTAQGMTQGLVIFMMPYGVASMYFMSDPDSLVPVFTTKLGLLMLFMTLALDLIGGAIILKIVKIKV